ncbi:GNAT family N-acetyltransferase [candidate division WOR-3 bacterium]|uniref:GNAT family N-acetyltransferase n=1 Tax=candidate division WOR-3 bacterium TaxID=2052148 RepID=A0A937XFN2_UNCW3|nr:GNAT family N-acetyltransferase [candidate division WOR-3 bacterium]
MDSGLPVIETARLTLRPFSLADAGRAQQMCNDWEIASTTLAIPHPYPDGAAEQWISTHADSFRQGTDVILAITLRPGGQVIGSVGLSVNKNHGRGELGYMVAKESWNRGYCTEAARAMMSFGFSTLGLDRIQAGHFPRNPASGRVMQKLGMTREGVLRQYVSNRGTREDIVMYAILRSEFEASERKP